VAVAAGRRGRPGASSSRTAAVLGAATGISWGFMAAVIKELSSRLGGGPGAVLSTWPLYLLLAAGAATMLLASHALAAGPLAASQPGFTILDPLTASLLGMVLFGEHIQTGPAALAGETAALAVVIAGAIMLSRSGLIADENEDRSGAHQPALSSPAGALPATRPPAHPTDPPETGRCRTRRPPALSPDVAVRADGTLPSPVPAAAARAGAPRPAWGSQDLDPERAAA
jgi:hypothetical protein